MTSRRGSPQLVKVTFDLAEGSWHGHATESVWAEPLGEDRFRIRNVPFYVLGIGVEDIVQAQQTTSGLKVTRVMLHAGHSTYRVFLGDGLDLNSPSFVAVWTPLARLGCTFERATPRLLAIDVPRQETVRQAYALLEEGEARGVWEFEEGHAAT